MSAYRSSLFRSLKKEVSEKLPQDLPQYRSRGSEVKLAVWFSMGPLWRSAEVQCRSCSGGMYDGCGSDSSGTGVAARVAIRIGLFGGVELSPRCCCWHLTRLSGADIGGQSFLSIRG